MLRGSLRKLHLMATPVADGQTDADVAAPETSPGAWSPLCQPGASTLNWRKGGGLLPLTQDLTALTEEGYS